MFYFSTMCVWFGGWESGRMKNNINVFCLVEKKMRGRKR
jgi:hypothetical protein